MTSRRVLPLALVASLALGGGAMAGGLPPGAAATYLVYQQAKANGDHATADQALRQLMQLGPVQTDWLNDALLRAVNAGNLPEAEVLAQQVLAGNDKAHLARLVLLVKASDPAKVKAIATALPDEGIGKLARPLLLAWALAGQNNPAEAVAALKPLEKMPGLAPLYNLHMGVLADRAGDMPAATKYFKTMLEGKISDRAIAMVLEFYNRRGLTKEAEALEALSVANGFDKAVLAALQQGEGSVLLTTPQAGMADALYGLASVLKQEGAAEIALPYAQLARALKPELRHNEVLTAELLAMSGRVEAAMALYQQLSLPAPLQYAGALQQVAIEAEHGAAEAALTRLEALVAATPDRFEGWQLLADMRLEKRDFAGAEMAFSEALKRLPEAAEATSKGRLLSARGQVRAHLQNYMGADLDLQSALVAMPKSAEVLNALGYMWAERGVRLDDAVMLLQRAVSIAPDNAAILDSLAWAYYRQGDLDKAVVLAEQAVSLLPYDATLNDHLGDIYWASGRQTEARFQWQRALRYREETGTSDLSTPAELQQKLAEGLPIPARP